MTPAPAIEEAYLSEVYFECTWILEARNRLLALDSAGDHAFGVRPFEQTLERWSYVDQMLVHLERLDRLLNPTKGHGTPDSYAIRRELAKLMVDRGYPLPGSVDDLRSVRDVVEHADEHLPEFIMRNPGRALGPFAVGPLSGPNLELNYIPLRSYNTVSGECSVNGKSVNLAKLVEEVRTLRFSLPRPGVTPRLTTSDIPSDKS